MTVRRRIGLTPIIIELTPPNLVVAMTVIGTLEDLLVFRFQWVTSGPRLLPIIVLSFQILFLVWR